MQVEIDKDVEEHVQSLTSIKLNEEDYYFFVDWLVRIGVETVRGALNKHPELTLGDLVMMQFRNEDLH